MKWLFLLVVGLLIGAAVYLYPMVYKEKTCFDTTQSKLTDIQYYVVVRGLSKEDVCSQRSMMLLDLEDCIKAATAGSTLARHVNSIIENTVYFIRPLTKSLTTLKNEHNTDCSDYERFQLE
jgi:hypothetical protein